MELGIPVLKMLATLPTTLLYDGSFDGFLSAVFEATRLKLNVERIVAEPRYVPGLFEEPRVVSTVAEQAERVWAGIENKVGRDISGIVRGAFLSELPDIETCLWHYLRKIFADPTGHVARNVLDEHTHLVLATARKVSHETHLFTGFVRFQTTESGLMVAVVEPQYNVLELLVPHFVRRFPNMAWMIVDGPRGRAVRYDGREVQELSCDPATLVGAQGKVEVPGAIAQDPFGSLWLRYYDSVNIAERTNPRRVARLLPRKYWKYLPERQERFSSSRE